ncbi:hypothetical protein HU811_08745 [Pseudomonas sp. SWRI196]|uniref:Uncharacterized protein n=1 Tax=Pseudomonas tehranensis TaxID=2745502 RepID=A0ABR6UQ44_9PSED|nr:hypothetical protein [Pseudomonas tehranensis]MBC3346716.1 hypothetical protein [Pseudomonas tehranensis]
MKISQRSAAVNDLSVGAKLARDEVNAIFLESRRLYREQALLPQVQIQGIDPTQRFQAN